MNHPVSDKSMTMLGIVISGIVLLGITIQFSGW
jgi:hypothetical protein